MIKGDKLSNKIKKTIFLLWYRVDQAQAVFIISCRCSIDKDEADQHTILRSWAIKEFAPNTSQYVQLFRPENRIHIKFVGN